MIGKNKIKLINSLKIKKYRKKYKLFLCEGLKTAKEFITSGYEANLIFKNKDNALPNFLANSKAEIIDASLDDFKKLSSFKTPSDLIVVFKLPEPKPLPASLTNELILYCDGIQDPGNLGTIIRTSAWFGLDRLICSPDTSDIYNPKTIQSAMGATAKIPVDYVSPDLFFNGSYTLPKDIFGADMKGENIYKTNLPKSAVVIMGNEGQGIRPDCQQYINRFLHIPAFTPNHPESLNVSVATSIILSEFRRQSLITN